MQEFSSSSKISRLCCINSSLLNSHCSAVNQHEISISVYRCLLRALYPFPLVRVQYLRYKPGLRPDSDLYLFLCFVSWPLHFPHPAQQSLGCLWNGSSTGLLWDITEKPKSVAPSPLCSCRVSSGLVNSGLALQVFRLVLCAFVRDGARPLCLDWFLTYFFLHISQRCHTELGQQPNEIWLDRRTIFFFRLP